MPPLPPTPPCQVGKQSKAAMSLCLWVRAMDNYAAVFKTVEPKRLALAAAQVRCRGADGLLRRAGTACPIYLAAPTHPPASHHKQARTRSLLPRRPQVALDASNAVVAEKRARLAESRAKVAALQRRLAETQAELASLARQVRRGCATACHVYICRGT